MRPYLLSTRLVVVLIVLSFTIESDAQAQLWCVANPKASEAALWSALQWACVNGADCIPLQQDMPCHFPDTVAAHASYAFNSYWQKFKKTGGTCSFNGVAIPTNIDPSHGPCHYDSIL